ncbi:hypothetical protein OG21DRAFT_1490143 [Imleria badia]|nr:hypothetical protein OG21DRAFT_1490143 [Imleria badia]
MDKLNETSPIIVPFFSILIMPSNLSGHWSPPTTVHPSQLHEPLPSGCTHENFVPPYTGQTPTQLLERYYGGGNKSDSTGPKGILPGKIGAALGPPGSQSQYRRAERSEPKGAHSSHTSGKDRRG